jgi:hypothetical protein
MSLSTYYPSVVQAIEAAAAAAGFEAVSHAPHLSSSSLQLHGFRITEAEEAEGAPELVRKCTPT